MLNKIILTIIFLYTSFAVHGQHYIVAGSVLDKQSGKAVPYAYVITSNNKVWAVADKNGNFEIRNLIADSYVLTARSLGYLPNSIKVTIEKDIYNLKILLQEVSLEVNEVVVTAKSLENNGSSSSYIIDRTAIDHLQVSNLTDIMSLLPGGKFHGDLNLINGNSRFQVRGNDSEMGSVSFGTAVEIDGVRLSNNAAFDNTKGADNRSISVANIESVEVVTGVPSVEYGDLNNGLVKVTTTKGQTPYVIELSIRPHTQRFAIQKGFSLWNGILNITGERAKSVSNLTHPYTTYDRNGVTLNYSKSLNKKGGKPLTLNVGVSGNIGGYDSKADPDQQADNYVKLSHNTMRANVNLNWLLNSKWLTKLGWSSSVNYSDKLRTENMYNSHTSSTISVHSMNEGYYVATDYDHNPNADVILRPAGRWDELSYYDDKPLYFTTKIKSELNKRLSDKIYNRFMLGAEYSYAKNFGQGEYYADMQHAPTWRPFRFDELPSMNNVSLFMENNIDIQVTQQSSLKVMAGIRSDATYINKSEYGLINSLSPRFNAHYIFFKNRDNPISDLSMHVSWGRAVKLPSFNILYPRPSYVDIQTFAAPSDAVNTSYQAYLTMITQPTYNADLRWQSSNQWEVGVKADIWNTRFNVVFFRNITYNNYKLSNEYTPFSYNYTGPSSLEGLLIPSSDRIYMVDQNTGIVTVSDKTGTYSPKTLDYRTYNKFRSSSKYVNGSPIKRYGVEWSVDFPEIELLKSKIRIDGNYYQYKGLDEELVQGSLGQLANASDNSGPYQYIGHYIGARSVANGSFSRAINLNAMITTHIPKVRMIVSLRIESTLMKYNRALSEYSGGSRSYAVESSGQIVNNDTDIYKGDTYVVSYPLYYSTWDNPDHLIPFKEKLLWAQQHDRNLYNDLSRLVEKSNHSYAFNPRTISPHYSINLSITKEIGDIASVSFYATNFLNNIQTINSSWDGLIGGTIYNSGYIARFYYGLSLRIKI